MKKDIKILAIETSCDETAAAVICGRHPEHSEGSIMTDSSAKPQNDKKVAQDDNFEFPIILSNIVSSQIDLHAKTGGVVPEVASRAHMESMVPVISEALIKAKMSGTQEWTANKTDGEKVTNNNLITASGGIPSECGTIEQFNNEPISFLQKEIDYIAVTAGPGLVGSLLVGFNAAKSLAYALDKPIIAVNHIEGHIYSAFAEEIRNLAYRQAGPKSEILIKSQNSNDQNSKNVSSFELRASNFPLISLTVSGGHTSITLMKDHGQYENIGQTLDDAAGEAFDKVAKLLDLGYPGGPIVSKLASHFRTASEKLKVESRKSDQLDNFKLDNLITKLVFPRPILNDGTFNFSFSGLKTAVLQKVLNIKKEIYYSCHPERSEGSIMTDSSAKPQNDKMNDQSDINSVELPLEIKMEICAAFEDAVVDVLITKTIRAAEKYKPKAIILAGGVAANDYLRNTLKLKIEKCKLKIDFLLPPKSLCGDNAAMIGLAAYYHIQKENIDSWDEIKVDSNLEL